MRVATKSLNPDPHALICLGPLKPRLHCGSHVHPRHPQRSSPLLGLGFRVQGNILNEIRISDIVEICNAGNFAVMDGTGGLLLQRLMITPFGP